MTSIRIPTVLVIGATGAGKTTLLLHMLGRRPPEARWAVLVNDFGDTHLSRVDPAVTVREVSGCICCSAQVSLRTAFVTLLRQAKPQRLLIEASSAAHPGAIVKVLREPGLASSVELERVVCVVDPRQVLDARYAGNDLYREQLKAADEIVMSRSDAVGASKLDAAIAVLERFGLTSARVGRVER